MKHYYYTFNGKYYIIFYHTSLILPDSYIAKQVAFSRLKNPVKEFTGLINKIPNLNQDLLSEIMDFKNYTDDSKTSVVYEYNYNSDMSVTIYSYDS